MQSRALCEINKKLIAIKNSSEYQYGSMLQMIFNAIKNKDLDFFKRHIIAKLHKNKFNSKAGNLKYILEREKARKQVFEKKPKVCVYSCIAGNYDTPLEPLYSEGIDFVLFTDQKLNEHTKWTKYDISSLEEYRKETNTYINRKIKLNPSLYLKGYDYTIYIDGNIQIVADLLPLIIDMGNSMLALHLHANRDCIYQEVNGIKLLKKADTKRLEEQMNRYKREGYPEHFGLFQNSIIICNHNLPETDKIMGMWWEEYKNTKTRDQLSLPFILWKNKINTNSIYSLGNDVYQNPRFYISEHNKKHVSADSKKMS